MISSGMGWGGIVSIPIPPDGPVGFVLTKASNGDYDLVWSPGGGGGGSVADGNYGDVTVSGVGTVWTINPTVVTYAKIQNTAAASIVIGRGDSGPGSFQELSLGTSLSIVGTVLDAIGSGASVDGAWKFNTSTVAADPGNQKFRLNNATLASVTAIYVNDNTLNNFDASTIIGFLRSGNRIYIQQRNDATRAALFLVTGSATNNTGWWTIPVTTVLDSGVLYQNNGDCSFVFVLSAAASVADANYGDITVSGGGTVWTVNALAITNAKLANVATQTFKGRTTAGTGSPEDLTIAQAQALLSISGVNTGDQTITLTTDVTGSGTGTFATTIAANAVTNAKLAQMAANTVKANATAALANAADLAVGTNTVLGRAAGNIVAATLVDAQITANTISAASQAQMAANTVKSNATAALANESDLSVPVNTVVGRVAGNIVAAALVDSQITANTISNASLAQAAANTLKGNATAGAANVTDIAVGTNTVVGRVAGNIVAAQLVDAQITVNTISNASRAQMTTNTVKANATAGTANEADLTIPVNTVLGRVGANIVAASLVDAQITANTISVASQNQIAAGSFMGRNTAGTGNQEVLSIATAKTMLSLVGTNTGDQTITLTGDVTGSGTGSFAATIANSAVTYAKMQNASAASILIGRGAGAGAGVLQEITLGTNLSMAGTVLNATGGGGSFAMTQATINLPYAAKLATVNVVDAAITATDKIVVVAAGVADTQVNASDGIDIINLSAVPKAGSMDVQVQTLTPCGGPLVINYARAA